MKQHPLWKLRTKEEAKAAWDAEFGLLEGGSGGGEAESAEAGSSKGKGGGLHAEAGEAIP